MSFRSDSSSENAPVERIKRIRDIAASRKEEVGKQGKGIRQQALERSAIRTNKSKPNNGNCFNQKLSLAESRESKKVAFAEEFSKMGCLKCNEEEGLNKVDSRTGRGRMEHPTEQPPKPRWNFGTITSKITESHDLYGYQEPFIRNSKQKHVACSKDGNVYKTQSKTKPSVKDASGHRQMPIIQSFITENKRNRTDMRLASSIPKQTSEPYDMDMTNTTSTKIHQEKCHATDTPNTGHGKHTDNNVYAAATKHRKAEAVSAAADKQCNTVFAKDRKPYVREKKVQMERSTEKNRTVAVKEEAASKAIKPTPFKSRIPALSKTYTDVDSSLGLGHSQYFREPDRFQCHCQCHCKSNIATVAVSGAVMSESVDRESKPPLRKVTDNVKKGKKLPSKKRPGTPR